MSNKLLNELVIKSNIKPQLVYSMHVSSSDSDVLLVFGN